MRPQVGRVETRPSVDRKAPAWYRPTIITTADRKVPSGWSRPARGRMRPSTLGGLGTAVCSPVYTGRRVRALGAHASASRERGTDDAGLIAQLRRDDLGLEVEVGHPLFRLAGDAAAHDEGLG